MVTATAPAPDPDTCAFDALVHELNATGQFATVRLGHDPKTAADCPSATVTPLDWSDADEVDPTADVHEVHFKLTITSRHEDETQRLRELLVLTNLARHTIHGSNLGGHALPPLTRISRGTIQPAKHPEQSTVLTGEFTRLDGETQCPSRP